MEKEKKEEKTDQKKEKGLKGISDPVHSWIPISDEEMRIIDHPIFQRLRYVRQLNGSDSAFPNAKHTRFSHSIGAMHVAGLYVKHLLQLPVNQSIPLTEVTNAKDVGKVVRIAALLHDIAHGFCSHEFDKIYQEIGENNLFKDHDSLEIEKTELDQLRKSQGCFIDSQRKGYDHDQKRFDLLYHCKGFRKVVEGAGVTFEEIANVWNGKDSVLHAIVQGPMGADRSDFLLRDALFTAVSHGNVPIHRLIELSSVQKYYGLHCLAYAEKGLSSICSFLLGRFDMYRQVYFHKTSCAESILLAEILKAASHFLPIKVFAISNDEDEFFKLRDDYILGFFDHHRLIYSDSLDDHSIHRHGRRMLEKYLKRDLPKMCVEYTIHSPVDKTIMENSLKTLLNKNGLEEKAVVKVNGPLFMLGAKSFEKDCVSILSCKNDNCEVITFRDAVNRDACYRSILDSDVGYYIVRVFVLDEADKKRAEILLKSKIAC